MHARERPLLGAALIVRDEERCLARCLASVRDVVDEIVVVDTGSVDRSVAIAEQFGALVIHRAWDGDFSAARNAGLDRIDAQFVLYIDADEYLAPTTRAHVERELRRPGFVAHRIMLRHRPGFTPYLEYRLWANRPDIRFWGVIHESIVPAILVVGDREGLLVGKADLQLEHDGYEHDQSAKHERNLPLLLEQIRNHPSRTYLWDHVGRIYAELGNAGQSRAAFEQGVALVRRNGVLDVADGQVYADLIHANATHETPDAELVAEAVARFPENALVRWACALDSLARGSFEEVEGHVDALLAISPESMAENALGINMRVQAEWAFHVRGMARFQRGDYGGAAADFRTAEAADSSVPAYRIKRTLAEARARA